MSRFWKKRNGILIANATLGFVILINRQRTVQDFSKKSIVLDCYCLRFAMDNDSSVFYNNKKSQRVLSMLLPEFYCCQTWPLIHESVYFMASRYNQSSMCDFHGSSGQQNTGFILKNNWLSSRLVQTWLTGGPCPPLSWTLALPPPLHRSLHCVESGFNFSAAAKVKGKWGK